MTNEKDSNFLEILGAPYDQSFFSDKGAGGKRQLDQNGILILEDFVSKTALTKLKEEAMRLKNKAYRSRSSYNVYVAPDDKKMAENSPRNRRFVSTKGCIADDEIPQDSILRTIYNADLFRRFICALQGINEVYSYGDPLSSININYYGLGDSLEWHFDNADFAITLLVRACDAGGIYEYVPEMRYTREGTEDYEMLGKILDGTIEPKRESVAEGSLMIFRGNRSVHRVTSVTKGERMLVTLNYNVKPNIPLSEESRMTFFGRLG